jgi:hypothetical protein
MEFPNVYGPFLIKVNGNPQTVQFRDVNMIEKSHMAAWKIPLLVVGIVAGVVVVATGILVAAYGAH